MREIDGFYALLAQVTFTVLAFWLAVAQVGSRALLATAGRRRAAHAISLHLALPAAMSLMALVDSGNGFVWRVAFVVGAVWGAAAALLLRPRANDVPRPVGAAAWALTALWGAVALAGVAPDRGFDHLGVPLTPLQTEAGLLALVVFVTLNQVFWLVFAEPADR